MFGTPYCEKYARILEGSATNFPPLPPSDTPYSMLMGMKTHSQDIAAHAMCREYETLPFFSWALPFILCRRSCPDRSKWRYCRLDHKSKARPQ
jgi:hypothetical protein